jgi:hypothetical protein
VSQALYDRIGGKPSDDQLEQWAKSVFLGASLGEIIDLKRDGQHARLQQMKESMWSQFGYETDYIHGMAGQDFWNEEYAKIAQIDPLIEELRAAG